MAGRIKQIISAPDLSKSFISVAAVTGNHETVVFNIRNGYNL